MRELNASLIAVSPGAQSPALEVKLAWVTTTSAVGDHEDPLPEASVGRIGRVAVDAAGPPQVAVADLTGWSEAFDADLERYLLGRGRLHPVGRDDLLALPGSMVEVEQADLGHVLGAQRDAEAPEVDSLGVDVPPEARGVGQVGPVGERRLVGWAGRDAQWVEQRGAGYSSSGMPVASTRIAATRWALLLA